MNKVINNRELLRNYKEIKTQLLSGELSEVYVEQKNGKSIKLVVEQSETPAKRMLSWARQNPLPKFKRPNEDIF
jgi:hypothetical protein